MFLIARKTFLAKNLKKMRKLFPEEYDFFPRTWIIPNEINDLRNC
jgi:tubulin polyglutamylase TTLL6/13